VIKNALLVSVCFPGFSNLFLRHSIHISRYSTSDDNCYKELWDTIRSILQLWNMPEYSWPVFKWISGWGKLSTKDWENECLNGTKEASFSFPRRSFKENRKISRLSFFWRDHRRLFYKESKLCEI
jgi:hypothetical protein